MNGYRGGLAATWATSKMVKKKEISNFAAATIVFRSVELSEKVEANACRVRWVKRLLYWNRQQSSTSSDSSSTPRKRRKY